MNQEKVIIAGYGTLLLQESLGDTVAGSKKYRPIIIRNYKRLFNLLPDHYTAVNMLFQDGREKGAANIEPCEGAFFNGLCFEADASDLENLDKRERYYKRSQVSCFDFYSGEEIGICQVYESPADARWLVRDPEKLLPLWRDIVYARVGAYRIGREFGEMYDRTTFLADGKTLMADYYKDRLNELEDLDRVLSMYKK